MLVVICLKIHNALSTYMMHNVHDRSMYKRCSRKSKMVIRIHWTMREMLVVICLILNLYNALNVVWRE